MNTNTNEDFFGYIVGKYVPQLETNMKLYIYDNIDSFLTNDKSKFYYNVESYSYKVMTTFLTESSSILSNVHLTQNEKEEIICEVINFTDVFTKIGGNIKEAFTDALLSRLIGKITSFAALATFVIGSSVGMSTAGPWLAALSMSLFIGAGLKNTFTKQQVLMVQTFSHRFDEYVMLLARLSKNKNLLELNNNVNKIFKVKLRSECASQFPFSKDDDRSIKIQMATRAMQCASKKYIQLLIDKYFPEIIETHVKFILTTGVQYKHIEHISEYDSLMSVSLPDEQKQLQKQSTEIAMKFNTLLSTLFSNNDDRLEMKLGLNRLVAHYVKRAR